MNNVIFIDLDGPILDGKQRHWKCYRDIITEGGGVPIDIETYWNLKRSKIKKDAILEMSLYKRAHKDFYNAWLSKIELPEYLELDVLKPFIAETLQNWNIHYNVTLVTLRQNETGLLVQLRNKKIAHLFSEIICCDYRNVDSKYNKIKHVTFDNAIVVGATEEDEKTAALLVVPFCFIENGLRKKEFITADYTVKEAYMLDANSIFRDISIF
jgi:phosphoglycolate phosphatase-like HAD superfamily hydrolase